MSDTKASIILGKCMVYDICHSAFSNCGIRLLQINTSRNKNKMSMKTMAKKTSTFYS